MSLHNRVEKLEERMPERDGKCSCSYPGSVVIRTYYPGDAEDPTAAVPCEVCGGERRLIHLRVVYTREQLQEARA
jgi:hypothetical protein